MGCNPMWMRPISASPPAAISCPIPHSMRNACRTVSTSCWPPRGRWRPSRPPQKPEPKPNQAARQIRSRQARERMVASAAINSADAAAEPPHRLWTLLEGRAMFELGLFYAASPLFAALPRGDGRPTGAAGGPMAALRPAGRAALDVPPHPHPMIVRGRAAGRSAIRTTCGNQGPDTAPPDRSRRAGN